MDATSKTPGAGGRRGFQDHAYLDALGQLYGKPRSYCRCTPPNPTPAPRDPLTIASELYQAAECLADLAEDFAAGEYDSRALSSADALLVGCGRLVCELRQRREVRQHRPTTRGAAVRGPCSVSWHGPCVSIGRLCAVCNAVTPQFLSVAAGTGRAAVDCLRNVVHFRRSWGDAMRTLIGLRLALFVAILGVPAANAETTASRVFAADSPSVVVVTAVDSSGHVIAQGSGVVISRGVVVSNCHVFENRDTKTASVNYRGKSMSATLRYADVDHDLCSFSVAGIDAPAVTMRGADALKVGEDAYAIGAPEGYDLTLSAGIVSSLRKIPGGTVIQTTAPISPGSSGGGGLFDSEGRLIGITSYYAKEGQQINFALPVEWVKSLPQSGKTLQQLASQQPKSEGNYQDGVKAALAADYTAAFAIFKPLAERGDAKAQAELGWMYGQGNGVPQDYAEAAYWDRKAALQGDFVAQNNLAVLYGSGLGVGRDLAKAVYWYRKAASQGFAPAQYVVGVAYYSGQGVPQDYAQALYWYAEAAKQGNSDAQSYLGAMYAKGEGVPADYATSAYWRLKAADQGNTVSQAALGALYFAGVGVPQDFVQSAKWWILAQAGGEKSAVTLLPLAEKKMTESQIAEAQRLAREWWTAHHVQ